MRSCVHPGGKPVVLYAANALHIYSVETKEMQAYVVLPEPAVFLKWINDTTLGIVTGSAVLHWTLGEAEPIKKFDRHPTLAQSQIINYKESMDGKWCLLNGIAGGADGITGQLQLYSVERNDSQPLPAHVGTFATVEADQADLFAFAGKAGAGAELSPLELEPDPPVLCEMLYCEASTSGRFKKAKVFEEVQAKLSRAGVLTIGDRPPADLTKPGWIVRDPKSAREGRPFCLRVECADPKRKFILDTGEEGKFDRWLEKLNAATVPEKGPELFTVVGGSVRDSSPRLCECCPRAVVLLRCVD